MVTSRNGNSLNVASRPGRSAIGRAIEALADHLSDLLAGPGRPTPIPVRVAAQGSRRRQRARSEN